MEKKDEEAKRKTRVLVPGEDLQLMTHAQGPDALPIGQKNLVAAAASQSRKWRERQRSDRAWQIRPYNRELAVSKVTDRIPVDRDVALPKNSRALRYALGGPQVPPDIPKRALRPRSPDKPFDHRVDTDASPTSPAMGLTLEKRPRTGSPPPMRKYLSPHFPAGTFGHTPQ